MISDCVADYKEEAKCPVLVTARPAVNLKSLGDYVGDLRVRQQLFTSTR